MEKNKNFKCGMQISGFGKIVIIVYRISALGGKLGLRGFCFMHYLHGQETHLA